MPSERQRRLKIRIEALALPKRIRPEQYLRRLLRSVDTLEDLPPGWKVRLHWMNPDTQVGATADWQDADFDEAVQDSADGWGPGFGTVLRGMLEDKLREVQLRRRRQR